MSFVQQRMKCSSWAVSNSYLNDLETKEGSICDGIMEERTIASLIYKFQSLPPSLRLLVLNRFLQSDYWPSLHIQCYTRFASSDPAFGASHVCRQKCR
jgi:hypothetical protein